MSIDTAVRGRTYLHRDYGKVIMVHCHPHDGALLIVERVEDDDVLGTFVGVERYELHECPEANTDAMSVAERQGVAPEDDIWTMHVPVLSTAHLTYETANQEIKDNKLEGDLYAIAFPEGFMVFSSEAPDDGVPEDLRRCMKWAHDRGFEWVRFDSAGDQVGELPVYEW